MAQAKTKILGVGGGGRRSWGVTAWQSRTVSGWKMQKALPRSELGHPPTKVAAPLSGCGRFV